MALNFGLSVGSSGESVSGVSVRMIRKKGLSKGRSHEGREPRVHPEKEACSSLFLPRTDGDTNHSTYYRDWKALWFLGIIGFLRGFVSFC